VPSAVFTSVTGRFTFSVRVCAPLEYEPPATATFAVVFVSETSWNTGFAEGKFEPALTDSLVPFTVITAAVGGGVGGAGGVFGGLAGFEPVPPDDEELPDVVFAGFVALGPPALNGSLLSKSENDWSCPVPAEAGTASTSCVEPVLGAAAVVSVETPPPLSVGAAGSGVDATGAAAGVVAVVVRPAAAACGFDAPPAELSDIIVCTA
jgi:hypothetical protein